MLPIVAVVTVIWLALVFVTDTWRLREPVRVRVRPRDRDRRHRG